MVKSCNELERLFKIDVVGKGAGGTISLGQDIELILHFVNKERDPKKLPDVKRYILKSDNNTKSFLA